MSRSSDASTKPTSPRRPQWWPWHQRVGITFSAVIVVVVLTGIVLNHTGGLRLDQRFVSSPWLLDWYGMSPEGDPVAFQADGWAVSWDSQLYWNGKPVPNIDGETLLGATAIEGVRALLLSDSVLLLTPDGDLIERLDRSALPPGEFFQIGRGESVVHLRAGESRYVSDDEMMTWDRHQLAREIVWSEPSSLPAAEREAVLQAYRGQGLSLYRVILDLHSGRLFGTIGVWVVDVAAVAMLFLTLTGLWYALRVKRR